MYRYIGMVMCIAGTVGMAYHWRMAFFGTINDSYYTELVLLSHALFFMGLYPLLTNQWFITTIRRDNLLHGLGIGVLFVLALAMPMLNLALLNGEWPG